MKRFLTTLGLTCALGLSAVAGEIPSVPGPTPPGDGVTVESSQASLPGDIPSVDYSQTFFDEEDLVRIIVGFLI